MLRRKLLLDLLGRCARDAALWQCPIRKTAPIVVVLLMYGNLPRVADAATIRAYVTNWDDGTVSVIDAETFSVTATIPVGRRPIDVVAHPDGSRVYVSNRNSNTLSVIDTMTNEVTATVPMGGRPVSVDINSDGSRVYVANTGEVGLVQVVDTATNSVISDIRASATGYVAVHPDDSLVYASAGTRISVIDASTNERIDSVRTSLDGAPTWSLEVHPDGDRLYVNNAPIFPGFVGVIDTATMTQKSKIRVGQGATGIAIHPDGDSVYVSNRADDTISVIDTETDSVTDTISVSRGNFPTGLAVHPNGNLLYVTNQFRNSVSAIDLQTNEVLGTIPVGRGPNQATFAVLEPLSSVLLVGDIDGDGVVAFADFLILSSNFGLQGTQGDIDGDGTVGFSDFLLLADNFGKELEVAAVSVPEPAAGLAGIVMFFGLLGSCRRWRSSHGTGFFARERKAATNFGDNNWAVMTTTLQVCGRVCHLREGIKESRKNRVVRTARQELSGSYALRASNS